MKIVNDDDDYTNHDNHDDDDEHNHSHQNEDIDDHDDHNGDDDNNDDDDHDDDDDPVLRFTHPNPQWRPASKSTQPISKKGKPIKSWLEKRKTKVLPVELLRQAKYTLRKKIPKKERKSPLMYE